ncbi:hypothetical protein IFM89_027488 [Coptis chinensis]|uniref:Uncharacterized protein n=1 Tax=Coptis chinensis TaxID=261450 RepID=A0A835H9E0_9MAGN|nr:hypothetical protein IFM89_027488 [Coptis chinensis]
MEFLIGAQLPEFCSRESSLIIKEIFGVTVYGPLLENGPRLALYLMSLNPLRRWLAFQIQNHLMELTAKSIESADLNFSRYGDTFFECKDWYDVYEDEILIARAVVPFDYGMVLSDSGQTYLTCQTLPVVVLALAKAQQIRHVRLYDVDRANAPCTCQLVHPCHHRLISNNELLGVGQSNATAANRVARNVVYSCTSLPTSPPFVASNLDDQIKVSTPHSSSIIPTRFHPPSLLQPPWDPNAATLFLNPMKELDILLPRLEIAHPLLRKQDIM